MIALFPIAAISDGARSVVDQSGEPRPTCIGERLYRLRRSSSQGARNGSRCTTRRFRCRPRDGRRGCARLGSLSPMALLPPAGAEIERKMPSMPRAFPRAGGQLRVRNHMLLRAARHSGSVAQRHPRKHERKLLVHQWGCQVSATGVPGRSGALGRRCRKPASLFLTLDVCVALRFRDAILFHKPALAWLDGFATDGASSELWLSANIGFLPLRGEWILR